MLIVGSVLVQLLVFTLQCLMSLESFQNAFVSCNKTFFTRPNQFICAISVFCHAAMINNVHCMIFCLLNRKNNLFIEQFVTANLQPKTNGRKYVRKPDIVNKQKPDNIKWHKQWQYVKNDCPDDDKRVC